MTIQKEVYPLPVSGKFIGILTKEIERSGKTGENGLSLNFRDSKYSPELGEEFLFATFFGWMWQSLIVDRWSRIQNTCTGSPDA